MSRSGYQGPKLPKTLLDQVHDDNGNGSRSGYGNTSRKERRQEERQQKKCVRGRAAVAARGGRKQQQQVNRKLRGDVPRRGDQNVSPPQGPARKVPEADSKPLKSILKKEKRILPSPEPETVSDAGSDDSFTISRHAAKSGLAGNDDEIAALEKKLGHKGKKSQAEDEELSWLAGGSDTGSEDGGSNGKPSLKRKRPDDSKWLRDKRLKASAVPTLASEDEEDSDPEAENLANPFSEDELSDDAFEGFDEGSSASDIDDTPPAKKRRENPYVAPASKDNAASTAKYVPPRLRQPASSDEEALRQLRRQVQGLLNRLSEANMLSILSSLEELYTKNARQHVTSTLVDLLISLVSDPSTLNDTFLILHAGFSAAVYKVIGTDFGAQLLEQAVESFDRWRDSRDGKQSLNMLAFLSCLYNFHVVGSAIIFDYIRTLLFELTEANTELLLRVMRASGQQLRSDDPSSLKDIVLLVQRSVGSIGEAHLSVRTKFMIETINNLKNNRMKAGAAGVSAVAAEHTASMKKVVGSLNQRGSIRATEPLQITLDDIRNSEKKGKWWLVGASYNDPRKPDNEQNVQSARQDLEDGGYESETPGSVNLHKLARAQGMNTDVRRSIFITVLSSTDYKEAHMRLLKLHLKAKQQLEIPRVLVHCVSAEEAYNPFYALVARQFCGDHRLRKAFQFTLWEAFRQMEASDGEEAAPMSVRKIVNLAKFYGNLIATSGLSIAVLKKLDFAGVTSQESMFLEVLLTSVLMGVQKEHKMGKKRAGPAFEKAVRAVFIGAAGAPNIVSGLKYVMATTVSESDLVMSGKEMRAVKSGSLVAIGALGEAAVMAKGAPVADGDEDEDDL